MELKFKKIMAIVVLFGLSFTSYAEDEPEPNKPAIEKKADSSSERSEVELTTEPVPEGDNSADLIEAKLAKEYYKDCVQNLKWALGIIIGLVIVFIGYVSFKGSKEHREALADVKEALRDARSSCDEAREARDKARDYEEKAQERLTSIDKEIASKLKEIKERGEALITDMIQEAEKQREASREEAEKQRKISELWNEGLRAVKDEDFESAANYFGKIVKDLKVENQSVYYNWGNALSELAERKEGAESDELFRQSFEKYQKSLEIKPDKHEAYNNWGTGLSKFAQQKEGAEAEELFRQSFERYQKSVEIKPDQHEAYCNWGNALLYLARRKEGAESDELFRQSFEKYQKSVEIKPDKHEAYNNWGTALLELAKKKVDQERSRLLEEAKRKCLEAESIKKGEGSYNLACVCALLGDEKECERWLKIEKEAGTLPTRSHAMSDSDLESMWDKGWFKEIRWQDDAK